VKILFTHIGNYFYQTEWISKSVTFATMIFSMIDWLIDWLIDWCFTARQHKIRQFVPIYQGGLLAQAFDDSQRGTHKTIQLHAIQWTYTCNDKQQVCLTCLQINNAYHKWSKGKLKDRFQTDWISWIASHFKWEQLSYWSQNNM